MTIRRCRDGELACECDSCGAELYGGCTADFREFVEEVKAAGWRARKEEGAWVHYCDECGEG